MIFMMYGMNDLRIVNCHTKEVPVLTLTSPPRLDSLSGNEEDLSVSFAISLTPT